MLSLFCEKYVHEHLLKSEGPWQLLIKSKTLGNTGLSGLTLVKIVKINVFWGTMFKFCS